MMKKCGLFLYVLVLSQCPMTFASAVTATPCLYQTVYDAGDRTYLLYNALEHLSSARPANDKELAASWLLAEKEVEQRCKQPIGKALAVKSQDELGFHITVGGSKEYILSFHQSGDTLAMHLTKSSGAYKGEVFFSVSRTGGQKNFVRLIGRDGPAQKTTYFEFLYIKNNTSADLQSERAYDQWTNLFSLKKIYGTVPAAQFKLAVGVIGTGLDYNHPGLAHVLGFRRSFENTLQELDALRNKLLTHKYSVAADYTQDLRRQNELATNTGFPLWMDQAKGSRFPFDQFIKDGVLEYGKDHETRITSRIISRGDNAIEIFFARRMMGAAFDTLNVEEIVSEFNRQSVKIINMSFGSSCGLQPVEEAQWRRVFKAYPHIIFVVAAGNNAAHVDVNTMCPSFYSRENKNVISVTAVDAKNQLAAYNGVSVNFGTTVDVAIAADNLPVLVPLQHQMLWQNNLYGATSVAAAEISRILAEAIADGYDVNPEFVKEQLKSTAMPTELLSGLVSNSAIVNEKAFRSALKKLQQK